jgi:hypothetical protein
MCDWAGTVAVTFQGVTVKRGFSVRVGETVGAHALRVRPESYARAYLM